ncbi:MAG: PepSY-associated TM helix domain-containing protein [Pseudomonadota bacterium]
MTPIWPKIPSAFVRTMLASHSALGLFVAALCYLVCFTGTVAVFQEEFARWERPRDAVLTQASPQLVQQALESALALSRAHKVAQMSALLPTAGAPFLVVGVEGDNYSKQWSVAADGGLTETTPQTWTPFMAALHASFNVPGLIGYFIVGLAGVAMLALAISGLLSHPRIFRDAFALRWGGSKRLQEADLHNRLSVWGLPFNIAVSTTGAYLGIVSVFLFTVAAIGFGGDEMRAIAPFVSPEPVDNAQSAPLMRIDQVLNAVHAQNAQAAPYSLYLDAPGTAGQHVNVYASLPHQLRYGELYYAAADGPVRHVGYGDGSFGQQLYGAVYPIHFGDFGGLGVKALYGVLGLGLTIVCAGGVSIWLARRRDQARPAGRVSRLWIATVWSAPLALIVSAIAVLTGVSLSPVIAFWGAAAVAFVVAILVANDAVARRVLLGANVLALIGVVALHIALFGPAPNLVASSVNAALVVFALMLAFAASRPNEPPALQLIQPSSQPQNAGGS